MTDRELLYVKTIIEENSITKAAAKLYVAQPSLSQAVQKIEASLGVPLFERTSHGLLPTRDGMKYYEAASHILRIYHDLLEDIAEEVKRQEQLVLGTTSLLSNLLLGKMFLAFWKEDPKVKIHIREERKNEILQRLNDGEIHMAVFHMNPGDEYDGFTCELICKDMPILIQNTDGCFFQGTEYGEKKEWVELKLKELQEYPYIRYEDGSGYCEFVEKNLRKMGIKPRQNVMLTTNSAYTAIQIVSSTKGYTFCPRSCVPQFVPRKFVFPIFSSAFPQYDIYAVCSGKNGEGSIETVFLNFLKSYLYI